MPPNGPTRGKSQRLSDLRRRTGRIGTGSRPAFYKHPSRERNAPFFLAGEAAVRRPTPRRLSQNFRLSLPAGSLQTPDGGGLARPPPSELYSPQASRKHLAESVTAKERRAATLASFASPRSDTGGDPGGEDTQRESERVKRLYAHSPRPAPAREKAVSTAGFGRSSTVRLRNLGRSLSGSGIDCQGRRRCCSSPRRHPGDEREGRRRFLCLLSAVRIKWEGKAA